MTRRDKLLRRFMSNATISYLELQAVLQAHGFHLDRVRGSHHIYIHPDVPFPVSVQADGKDAKSYQIRQARDTIKMFNLRPTGE